ncbi:hypothetical protein D9611_004031 [Ephemerocybe angulata]|uniref:Homeobox domain-containing protein n=1 Tax=Ephemerocybe angulata TaxID=980116 RepID=A0A8H5B5Y5_9AGAR|nr:hypothetical protein D9611_004031 [Tulosesus angulatus]
MGFDNFAPNALHDPAAVDFRAFFPYTPNEVKHRKRTTSAQLKVLENIFKRDTKPNAALRNELAVQLDMTARGVQVWFQNRRAKEKTKSAKAAANGGIRASMGASPSSAGLLLDDDELDELAESPIQLPDASLKPNLHLITDSANSSWQNSPIEPPPSSAGYLSHSRSSLFAHHHSDLLNHRRGSLPANAFPPSSFNNPGSLESPSPGQWFDPMARRRSVDASLQRLAENPYADLARTKNTALFGARFGTLPQAPRHHSRVSISRRPALSHLSSVPHIHNIRRSSMDSRGTRLSLRTNALSPAPTNPPPFISSRASLPDHRLYAVSSRVVGSPIPGPLPSPNFSFGAASTPSMASPSSADSDRNSPDSLRSFTYPGNADHEDDGLSSPAFETYSRFNSIASVATSESSVNSSYYSDFGVDPLFPQDLHNGSRRNSCSPGQLLDFGDLDGNGPYGVTETHPLSVAGYPSDDYGISGPQGVRVPESVSNSYPSPASTISAGNSPHTLDAASVTIAASNIPISRTSELDFALQNSSEQAPPSNTQQRDHYTSTDQQKDTNVNLTTTSGDDASALSSSALYQPEHDLGNQGQYTYTSIPECYTPDGHTTMPISAAGVTAALYNSYGEINISSLEASSLQTANVEAFSAYT